MSKFKTKNSKLKILLLAHLLLLTAYSLTVPLGEAPDEPAHLSYARWIAEHHRLPANLDERREAGYKSVWPPLYHILAAGPLALVGDAPPTRLKSVGDTPRRLIPTNGQTIAAYIHTADEAWPWRGLPLGWRLARLVSMGLSVLSVAVTFTLARKITGRDSLALAAAGLHAFLPQALFIGSVLNDDTLLTLLSGLLLLTLFSGTAHRLRQSLLAGALLGLATVTKYNTLPLWGIVLLWLAWRNRRGLLPRLAAVLAGAAVTGGWWFGFIWRQFSTGSTLSARVLSALTAGTADASLQQLGEGGATIWPAAGQWAEWGAALFKSFWGAFGGGGAVELPGWGYGLLALACLAALAGLVRRRPPGAGFLAVYTVAFLPLPLARFILTGGHIAETAQGRHLFPALPAIALLLVWGWSAWPRAQAVRLAGVSMVGLLALTGLPRIQAAYPPPIPLYTTADAVRPATPVNLPLTETVTLRGYTTAAAKEGSLPVTLYWQATGIPTEDYRFSLTLTGSDGQPRGGWLGEPVGGRYPTRAWDKGDLLVDTVRLALLPGQPPATATLTLTLLGADGRTVAGPVALARGVALPAGPDRPRGPQSLRSDGLPPTADFTYRSTLAAVLPDTPSAVLVGPDGRTFSPARTIAGPSGLAAFFLVGPDWPTGDYYLQSPISNLPIPITNRPRRFEPPPMQVELKANFAGQLTLLGYDMPVRRVEPGGRFPVTLVWRAETTIGQNLVVFNHLLDAQMVQRGGSDRVPLEYYTTLLWVPGEIVADSYQVAVEAGAPPGVYWLDVGVYPAEQTARPLPLVVSGQTVDQNSVRLGPLKVGGPPPGATAASVSPKNPLVASFGGQITLLGYDPPSAGGEGLTLYWRAEGSPAADYTVFVHLLDPRGQVVAQADGPPVGGAYPSSLWEAGEIIIDRHSLPALPSGQYTVLVGLYRTDTGERLPATGRPDGAVALENFTLGAVEK